MAASGTPQRLRRQRSTPPVASAGTMMERSSAATSRNTSTPPGASWPPNTWAAHIPIHTAVSPAATRTSQPATQRVPPSPSGSEFRMDSRGRRGRVTMRAATAITRIPT